MIRPLAVAALALLLSAEVSGQVLRGGTNGDTPRRPVSTAHAITNARVVVAPGRVLDRATVVIRDGRIVAVRENADVPFDAQVIEGDSLTVYAGFVDAFAYAGVAEPEDPERYEGDPGNPPRERAGLTPDLDVRTLYDASKAEVKALREAGFTAAHLAPRDGFFAGTGAVVLLRNVARGEAAEMLFLPQTETAIAQIDPARGVYPGTPMGVLSMMRETVENARRETASRTAFRRDASGATRPMYDPVAEALAPVLDGDRALVFYTDGWLDAHRAIRVTEEMRIPNTVLAGVPDVSPVLAKIRARGLSVIAPLALPDTVKTDSLSRTIALPPPSSANPGGVSFVTDRRTISFRDTDAEKGALTAQRLASVGAAERSPSLLASGDVDFAFGSFEAKGKDIRANLRRMVEAGLSPEAALAALTTAPAEMMGLSGTLGTIERGKLANLLVTTGDYFSDSTDVRFVFVEGMRHEIENKPKAASGDPDAVVEIVGTWTYEIELPGSSEGGTMTFTGTPGSFEGTLSAQGETLNLSSVALDGNALTFSFTAPNSGPEITVSGIVSGLEFAGTADVGSFGAFPITATRQPE
ncbi:amidohydrolase family protein [Rubricoccus marinus]|uniref:Amidohydrolase-related domain-containing protein n=1 Tax=Rubricoccus marinus TaxID=716817 RepID=A0A259TYH0_9BACT|nr:amidohydrolase family protein [Rubricoccus marinus]OZC02628.1 hypothetical protein BSZ36_06345 [Rubricoccus marinus]